MSDINKEYDNLLNSTAITDEQVESISKVLEDNVENSEELKIIRDFPSNNNVEVNNDNEAGELKVANTILDPNTGESKIISTEDFDETIDDTSFEQLVADVESGKIKVESDDSPITEEEAKENEKEIIRKTKEEEERRIETKRLEFLIELEEAQEEKEKLEERIKEIKKKIILQEQKKLDLLKKQKLAEYEELEKKTLEILHEQGKKHAEIDELEKEIEEKKQAYSNI